VITAVVDKNTVEDKQPFEMHNEQHACAPISVLMHHRLPKSEDQKLDLRFQQNWHTTLAEPPDAQNPGTRERRSRWKADACHIPGRKHNTELSAGRYALCKQQLT
jgi:hypothetical protein